MHWERACTVFCVHTHTETFKRKGADLYTLQKIPLATALCGGQFTLTHLDDRVLIMTNAAGSVIKPGMTMATGSRGLT